MPTAVQLPANRRPEWLRGFAHGLTDESAAGQVDSPAERAGQRVGQDVRTGEVTLNESDSRWVRDSLGLYAGQPRGRQDDGTSVRPAPSDASTRCIEPNANDLESQLAQQAMQALQDLLNGSSPGQSPGDESNGGGGGGGGGGGYAPSSPSGSLGPRRSPAEIAAENRCVAGLSLMLSGIADLKAGLAAQTAEASAQLGRAQNPGQAAALLQAARNKLECGRIALGARTYTMAGLTAEECQSVRKLVRDQDFSKLDLPSERALDHLPDEWQKLLNADPTGQLVRDFVRILNCKQTGGRCRLQVTLKPGTAGADDDPSVEPVDVGAACQKDPGGILNRLFRIGKDDPCTVDDLLETEAARQGLPVDLVRAVAWTESNWNQWNRFGSVLHAGNDYGLMQINSRSWGSRYDWGRISNDVRYNVRAGGDILAWSYRYAKSAGYSGTALWQATYAVYNGGPKALNRPWRSSRYSQHDRNFSSHLRNQPWSAYTQGCL